MRIRACARRNPPKRYGKTHMPSSSSSLLASVLLAASTSFVVSEARFFLFTTDCHVIVNTCINILQISITNRLTTTHRWMHRNFQSNILFMRPRHHKTPPMFPPSAKRHRKGQMRRRRPMSLSVTRQKGRPTNPIGCPLLEADSTRKT